MKKTKTFTITFALYMFIAPFLPSLREGPGMGCYAQPCGATYTDTVAKILYDQRDCRQYPIEKIGSQWWMTENLDYLPAVVGPATDSYTIPYYYVYNYNGTDTAAAKLTTEYATYGVLYNWTAAMNGAASSDSIPSGVQGVCPTGWHLPSDAEWKQLEMNLGISQAEADAIGWRGTDEGGKLKETGTSHWASPNTGATNTSGFTALPGGSSWAGSFNLAGYRGYWWSSTEASGSYAWFRVLVYSIAQVYRSYDGKALGFSCRCVKDIDSFVNLTIIQSTGDNQLKVYPNPSRGIFTMEIYDLRSTIYDLRIYDVLGREIHKSKITNQKSQIKNQKSEIDLSGQPEGIYHLQLITDKGIMNTRVVIE